MPTLFHIRIICHHLIIGSSNICGLSVVAFIYGCYVFFPFALCFFFCFFSFLRHVPPNQFPTSVPRKPGLLIRHIFTTKMWRIFYAVLERFLHRSLLLLSRICFGVSAESRLFSALFYVPRGRLSCIVLHFGSGPPSKNATDYNRFRALHDFWCFETSFSF